MKILAVKIQNLASLRGTFVVNFQEFFEFGNVVLIHGPTGAGKTTILDAISLAIFGQTARSSGNNIQEHIMTTGEGFCTASVLVDIQRTPSMSDLETEFSENKIISGIYKFTWSLKRAREQAQGNLQHPEFFIDRMYEPNFDGNVAQAIFADRKVKTWRKYVSNILGNLTFEDFARSCFLFQSEYSQFLTASPMQKASLLATLTHTEYFKKIGEKITQRFRDQETELNTLHNATRNHLSEEQLKQTHEKIVALELDIETKGKDLLVKQGDLKIREEHFSLIISYENLLAQWKESLAGKISQDRAKALERDRNIRHLEVPLQRLQKSNQMYDGLLNDGGIQLFEYLRIKDTEASPDSYSKLNAILRNFDAGIEIVKIELQKLEQAFLLFQKSDEIETQIQNINQELEKERERVEKLNLQITEIETQLSDKITKKAQLQALLLYSKSAPNLILSLENASSKQLVLEIWETHLKNCGLQKKSIPPEYSRETFEEIHLKLIDKLLHRSRQYEVAKHEFEIQKTKLQVLQEEEQKISTLCQNKEAVLHNLTSKKQDIKQEITEIVGTLEHNHIPIQIHSYKKTLHESNTKYRLLQRIINAQQDLYVRQQEFLRGLKEANITEQELITDLLSQEIREKEERRYAKHVDQDLVEKLNNLKAKLKDLFREEVLTDYSKYSIEVQKYQNYITTLRNEIDSLHGDFVTDTRQKQILVQKIDDHKSVDLKKVDKRNLFKSQRSTLEVLHQMLGSRRAGRNLRVLFEEKAQAYNLQRFIQLTNQHVYSLTEGRYELKPRFDNGRPTTDFRIQDHTQFSERDIVSLSGGETFQLSVGLALGIGELQYNYEPIESLFIDEGFGSLDEDSLHLVTHTLSKLSQRLNKQIILISHVPQLRQEYPVRIEVLKNADGSSVIKKHIPTDM